MNESKGLYGKYKIEKVDGTPIDPEADYFVLRLDKDPHARTAAIAYSDACFFDNQALSGDLLDRINEIELNEIERDRKAAQMLAPFIRAAKARGDYQMLTAILLAL